MKKVLLPNILRLNAGALRRMKKNILCALCVLRG